MGTHLTEAAHRQRNSVGHKTQTRLFNVDDPVWLSIPTAGKLDPRWEGEWRMHAIPGPVTFVIHDGARYKTVHVNHLGCHIQPDLESTPIQTDSEQNHTT